MSWQLKIWWGYNGESPSPPFNEAFNTKNEGLAAAASVISDGYTVSSPGEHHFYPAAGITHVSLIDLGEE